MIADSVSLSSAVSGLKNWLPVSVETALEFLRTLEPSLTLIEILNWLRPDLDTNRLDFEDLRWQALDAINDIARLDENVAQEELEEGDLPILYPANMGYPMGWDEYDELLQNLSNLAEGMRLYMFFTMLRTGRDESFQEMSDYFGWQVQFAPIEGLDFEVFKQETRAAGLEDYYWALRVSWYCTDNVYFDFNPWDENGGDWEILPNWTREDIEALAKQYDETMPISEANERAVEQFARDATIAGRLLECMVRSSDLGRTHPAMTLAELWAADETESDEDDEIDSDI